MISKYSYFIIHIIVSFTKEAILPSTGVEGVVGAVDSIPIPTAGDLGIATEPAALLAFITPVVVRFDSSSKAESNKQRETCTS